MQASLKGVSLLSSVFGYNRDNFGYDRHQRLNNEFQIIDMRLEQTALWRDDVREIMSLPCEKIEIYLSIAAWLIAWSVCAICEGRVPPGSPPWLCNPHMISMVTSFMYLFLAIWFGMHAFVAAQAYKVRILTQLVRLPIPTWRQLEAIRTYLSQFESSRGRQLLRVPFMTGRQSSHVSSRRSRGPNGPSRLLSQRQGATATDPWGLEGRGDALPELAPQVNEETEAQRHIWLVREAAMYYQTYDAFCRISLNAGSVNLAVFFAYYCITYVLTENGGLAGGASGCFGFMALALLIFRLDMFVSNRAFLIGAVLLWIGPVLTCMVSFVNVRLKGHPQEWVWLMPVAMGLSGLWHIYYLYLFRVRETLGGQLLPLGFRQVLYLDPFAWAKHGASWWRRLPVNQHPTLRRALGEQESAASAAAAAEQEGLQQVPAASCINSARPVRPEDPLIAQQSSQQNGSNLHSPGPAASGSSMGLRQTDHLRPSSFQPRPRSDVEDSTASGFRQQGSMRGQRPGQLPWQVFSAATQVVAICWWAAGGLAAVEIILPGEYSGVTVEPVYGGIPKGRVSNVRAEFLQLEGGQKLVTEWPSELTKPHGFACASDGSTFLTSGYNPSLGYRGLLLGQLSVSAVKGGTGSTPASSRQSAPLQFGGSSACADVLRHAAVKDLAMDDCNCAAPCPCKATILLQQASTKTVECELKSRNPRNSSRQNIAATADHELGSSSLPLAEAWLHQPSLAVKAMRGTSWKAGKRKENVSSVALGPCHASGGTCMMVGTTHRRLAHMEVGEIETEGQVDIGSATASAWVPRRIFLQVEGDEVHGVHNEKIDDPGALAMLARSKLAVLQKSAGVISVLDLSQGGSLVGFRKLPSPTQDHPGWSAICAGGGALFALESGDAPHVWKFPLHSNGLIPAAA